MPTVTKTGDFYRPQGTALLFTEGGAQLYILQSKVDKHLIGTYMPPTQGFTHTGVMTDNQDIKLYKQFAAAFQYAFEKLESLPRWIELEFTEKELEVSAFGMNVVSGQVSYIKSVKVGASIEPSGMGCIIYINHGPLIT